MAGLPSQLCVNTVLTGISNWMEAVFSCKLQAMLAVGRPFL